MKCPSCAADVQWVGKFGVCSEHGQVAMREEPAPLAPIQGSLSQRILERYPFAIAHGYQRTIAPESAAAAYSNFFFTYEATLQFVTLLLLAEFLQSERQVPELAMKLVNLRRPDLGKWTEAMFSLAKYWRGEHPLGELAHTARSFAKLSHDGRSLQDAVRNLRNTEMHYKSWTEPHCREQLARWVRARERTLEHFACLADYEVWRKTEGGAVRLVGANDRFETQPVHDAQLAEVFEISDLAVRLPAGELLPLRPLFVAPDQLPQGYSEPLLAFFGHTKSEVVYLGVSSEARRREELTRYEALLSAKDIDPRFTVAHFEPWTVSDWARESARVVLESLRGVKYFPDQYQYRRRGVTQDEGAEPSLGVDDVFDQWLAGGREAALIVAAEAGSGKTSLLCRAADELAHADGHDCVLLLTGGTLRTTGHGALFARIRDGLGFSDNATGGGLLRFDQLLERWLSIGEQDQHHLARRLVLLVDAVNEAADPKSVLEEVAALAESAASANRRAGRPFVRLVVSLRAERIRTLSERWGEHSDTPFLPNAHNFAHFDDGRGKGEPFLALRSFSLAEAEQAYGLAQGRATRATQPCSISWAALNAGTQQLIRHPLLLMLFHRTYAGATRPPVLDGQQTLWSAWLDRVFDPMQSSSELERRALDLAEACIDRGATVIPEELADEWHAAWRKELNHDPVRIAASLDWLERLKETGLLREQENGQLDWVSEAVAEQLYFRALRRRDPEMKATSVAVWLQLSATPRLYGALGLALAAAWRANVLETLDVIAAESVALARLLLRQALLLLAFEGGGASTTVLSQVFDERLESATSRWKEQRFHEGLRLLRGALTDSLRTMTHQFGSHDALLAVAEQGVRTAAALTALEPSTDDMLHLSAALERHGRLALRTDIAKARKSFEHGVDVCEKLDRLAPGNATFRRNLASAYRHVGEVATDTGLSRGWYEKARAVCDELVQGFPDNTAYLRDLSIAYDKLGDLDVRDDPPRVLSWYVRSRRLCERMHELEPDNVRYLRDLAMSYDRLGTVVGPDDANSARKWYQKSLSLRLALAQLEGQNVDYLRELSVSYSQVGDLDAVENPASARASFEQALAIRSRIVELEPRNVVHLRDLSISYDKLGKVGANENATRSWYEQALAIRVHLATLEPNNSRYLRDLCASYERLGQLETTGGQSAHEWHERAVALRERLAARDPTDIALLRELCFSYKRLLKALGHGESVEAHAWRERALPHFKRLDALSPDHARRRGARGILDQSQVPLGSPAVVVSRLEDMPGRGEACLVMVVGDEIGRRIALGVEPLVVGRSSAADLLLDIDKVSPMHAKIVCTADGHMLCDLGSMNGTLVNDRQVVEHPLRDGDQIRIGRAVLKFLQSGNVDAQYHEEIFRLMTVDGLTQVHNKRFFQETLEKEFARSARYKNHFVVLLFDIDDFKKVNEDHGHLAGDEVLIYYFRKSPSAATIIPKLL